MSNKKELVFDNIHYQPIINDDRAWKKIKKLDFNIPDEWVERGERDSFDRVKLLASDITSKGTVLDIGCNIGFFAHVLQFLGNKVTGIDNDVHVEVKKFTEKSSIDTARSLNKKYKLDVEFIEDDFVKYLESTDRQWDDVLFLSVFHHLFIGYGYSDFKKLDSSEAVKILQLIDRHTEKNLYFEMDEIVGSPFGWGSEEEVIRNIKMFTTFDKIDTLAVSKDGWAKGRTLLRCSRTKNSNRVTPKVIPLSSYSRRNAVGCVKDGGLYLTREANDWSAETHPYGAEIKRQNVLKEGKILKKLKENPHDNVCKVLDYDDDWVKIEYIEGKLLSSSAPYLRDQEDYLSEGIDVNEAIRIIDSLRSAVNHLHDNGIAHTDLISFNVMVDKNKTPKFIDVLGAVPISSRLETLDWEVFWKRCAMEVVERVKFDYLNETSDNKMQELAWGNDKRVVRLLNESKEKDETINQIAADAETKIMQLSETIKGYEDLHRSRIIKTARGLVRVSAGFRRKVPAAKNKAIRGAKRLTPTPIKKAIKIAKKKH